MVEEGKHLFLKMASEMSKPVCTIRESLPRQLMCCCVPYLNCFQGVLTHFCPPSMKKNNLPGLRSSKSESILKAVQGLTPSVAADNMGMSLGSEMTSSSASTAAVLHVPGQKRTETHSDLMLDDLKMTLQVSL